MNLETIITYFLSICGVYLMIGLLFAPFFIWRGLTKVDNGAEGAGIGFKLLILPGIIVFWPVLLSSWIKKLIK